MARDLPLQSSWFVVLAERDSFEKTVVEYGGRIGTASRCHSREQNSSQSSLLAGAVTLVPCTVIRNMWLQGSSVCRLKGGQSGSGTLFPTWTSGSSCFMFCRVACRTGR